MDALRLEVGLGLQWPPVVHEIAQDKDAAARTDVAAQRIPRRLTNMRFIQAGVHQGLADLAVHRIVLAADLGERVLRVSLAR